MGCCSALAKVFLVAVNIFFLVIGLAFFALGLFVRFGSSVINDYVDSAKKSIEDSVSGISTFGTIDLSSFDVTEMLRGVALGLIFTGLFLAIITFLGCCGGCCNVKCMLITYIVICCVLLVGQAVVVGILYGSPDTIHDSAKKPLKDKIQSDYAGLNGTDIISVGWNVVMIKVKCCGVNNYDDFTGAANWIYDYTSLSPPVTLKTPLACCMTLPDSDDFTCASITGATDSNNYQSTGCYDKIWDDTLGNLSIAVGALAGICLMQLLLVMFALVILCSGGKNKDNKVRPDERHERSPQHIDKRKEALRF
ncbi:tetraspanin-4-like [Mercenaria mercenaria]|uniref:tetraspanin-4-like n=1 Tax=Mercenaria mercenaria TaxID=6596 RepID=UPI00234F7298|nr:tetraspanin-4-like [Mercenaria mercenaria]